MISISLMCLYLMLVANISMSTAQEQITNSRVRCDRNCTCVYSENANGYMVYCNNKGLHHIPKDSPRNTVCLDLGGNEIKEINNERLSKLKDLTHLALDNNKLEGIKSDAFKGLDKLVRLDLSMNKIRYNNIANDSFDNLVELKYLDMKQNLSDFDQNETFPNTILGKLSSLEILFIDANGNWTFKGIKNLRGLKTLYFSNEVCGRCFLPHISRALEEFPDSIEELYLSNCSMIYDKTETFNFNFPNLTTLDISWNSDISFDGVINVSNGLTEAHNLKYMNLNGVNQYFLLDKCVVIPFELFYNLNGTALEVLTMEGNHVIGMENEAAAAFLKSIKYISIRDNMFMEGLYVKYLINRLVNIEYLDSSQMFKSHYLPTPPSCPNNYKKEHKKNCCKCILRMNSWKTFYSIILDKMKKLDEIEVAESNKNVLPGESKLKYLDLSENLPGTVNFTLEFFKEAKYLFHLNLSNNFVGYHLLNEHNEFLFLHFKSLRVLDLSLNKIYHIEKNALSKMQNLNRLYLGNNLIKRISFDLSTFPNLTYLDLRGNNLKKMHQEMRQEINMLPNLTINIAENNFVCDCSNLDFVKWIIDNENKIDMFNQSNCTYQNQTDVSFYALKDGGYECLKNECLPPSFNTVTLAASLCLVAFVIILAGGFIYRYKWNLRYLYYMTKFKLIGGYQMIRDDEAEFGKDVFVSYAEDDAAFVREQVVNRLEIEAEISLIVHNRDFNAGEFVGDNIVRAITNTRRTLVILTRAYLESEWCMYELHMARLEGIDTGRPVLCVIIKEDVPVSRMPLELMDVIRNRTYIEFPNREEDMDGFWERLIITLKSRR